MSNPPNGPSRTNLLTNTVSTTGEEHEERVGAVGYFFLGGGTTTTKRVGSMRKRVGASHFFRLPNKKT